MRENFELALSQAKGAYVIMIGDDDGLTHNTLTTLSHILSSAEVDFVSWPLAQYIWPGSEDRGLNPGMFLKRNAVFGPTFRVGTSSAEKLRTGAKVHFRELPKIYHGCVSRRLIESIRSRDGTVFRWVSPDIYFMAAAGLLGFPGITILHPLSINGGSPRSNGLNSMTTAAASNPAANIEFRDESSKDAMQEAAWNPDFLSISYAMFVCLCIAKNDLRQVEAIDSDAWIRRIVAELRSQDVYLSRALQASAVTRFDQPIIDALRNNNSMVAVGTPTAKDAAPAKPKSLLKACNLRTDLNGGDTILTAMQILHEFFGNERAGYSAWPGWQAYQGFAWVRALSRSHERLKT